MTSGGRAVLEDRLREDGSSTPREERRIRWAEDSRLLLAGSLPPPLPAGADDGCWGCGWDRPEGDSPFVDRYEEGTCCVAGLAVPLTRTPLVGVDDVAAAGVAAPELELFSTG